MFSYVCLSHWNFIEICGNNKKLLSFFVFFIHDFIYMCVYLCVHVCVCVCVCVCTVIQDLNQIFIKQKSRKKKTFKHKMIGMWI